MASFNYPYEKVSKEIPPPASTPVRRKQPNRLRKFLAILVIIIGAHYLLRPIIHSLRPSGGFRRCHKGMTVDYDDHHHHHVPVDDWNPFIGPAHFELEPAQASGFKVKGPRAFGKVVFETSKLFDKVIIDLDIRTDKKDENDEVTIEVDGGSIVIDTPTTGDINTYASAKIQIPSSIIGTFGLPAFSVDVPRHMVDFSNLPETLEIGALAIRIASGFIKAGPVHTNTTQLSLASGALKGHLTHAHETTDINIANGNATLDITQSPTTNSEAASKIHIGSGNLKGNFTVHKSTTIDIVSGSIYIDVAFSASPTRADLSTKIASGDARVFIDSIAPDQTFDAVHDSIAGNQLITYPSDFQGTIDARGLIGSIKLAGKDVDVETVLGGVTGKKGDSERNTVSVKAVTGRLDILVAE